jgi:hypothetical protein
LVRPRLRKKQSTTSFDLVQLDLILSEVQLVLLMTAALLVPLVVLPESNFVDITSTPKTTLLRMLGTLQAGILISRLALAFNATEQNRFTESLKAIKANRAVFAIVGSIVAVTAVSLISAVLSIMPHHSWWGRSPAGFESGEFTFLMYVVLSLSAFITIREINDKALLWKTLAITGVLAALVGFFQFLGWDRGMNYLIATQMASFQYRSTVLSDDDAIGRLEKATAKAPDVQHYWHDLAEIEHGRAAPTNNPISKSEALSRAYEYDLKGHLANPLEIASVYKLAFSAWESGNAGRPELRQKAVELYVYLTEIIPSDELAKERLQILTDYLSQQSE